MLGLFQKKLIKSGLLQGAMDRHSHILFGVDDGAKTITESLSMIDGLKSLGFRGAYCTPHIMARYPENTQAFLKNRFEELKEKVAEEQFDLRLAAEYMLDEQFLKKCDRDAPLTYDGQRILVELPLMALPLNWQEMIFQLKSQNYTPVMAHPERYWHLLKDEQDRELLREGCEFQLNLLSLSGVYGHGVRQQALKMIKEGVYTLFGTDLHRETQIHRFKEIHLSASNMNCLKTETASCSHPVNDATRRINHCVIA